MKSLEVRAAQTIGLKDWGWPAARSAAAPAAVRGFTVMGGRYWLVVMIGVFLGMGYLWFHSRVVDASWRIKGLEQRVDQLNERKNALKVDQSRLELPAAIMARLEKLNLDLKVPRPEQKIMVRNFPEAETKSQTLFSSTQTGGAVFLTVAP